MDFLSKSFCVVCTMHVYKREMKMEQLLLPAILFYAVVVAASRELFIYAVAMPRAGSSSGGRGAKASEFCMLNEFLKTINVH